MGTNFYFHDKEIPELIAIHIGKRSVAGLYCFDCRCSLCIDGEAGVHFSSSGWYQACPGCGQEFTKEELNESSVGVELGFNKNTTEKKSGVKSCSSFSWALDPSQFKELLEHPELIVLDEYKHEYSPEEIRETIDACPIKYLHSIGKEFC